MHVLHCPSKQAAYILQYRDIKRRETVSLIVMLLSDCLIAIGNFPTTTTVNHHRNHDWLTGSIPLSQGGEGRRMSFNKERSKVIWRSACRNPVMVGCADFAWCRRDSQPLGWAEGWSVSQDLEPSIHSLIYEHAMIPPASFSIVASSPGHRPNCYWCWTTDLENYSGGNNQWGEFLGELWCIGKPCVQLMDTMSSTTNRGKEQCLLHNKQSTTASREGMMCV